MEEKVLRILDELNEEITAYDGDNLFDAGIIDSLQVVCLIEELENEFNIEIDAKYLTEENFRCKANILRLVRELVEK